MVTNRYIGGGNDQVGTIIQYFGSNPPKGFLSCDGSIYNIIDYSRLANHIEGEFGSKNFFGGDGVTTFAVPDLRGEFLRGTGTNSHTNQGNGANVGVHQDGTSNPIQSIDVGGSNTIRFLVNSATSDTRTLNGDSYYKSVSSGTLSYKGVIINKDSSTGSATDTYTSRPTNTSVLYCIRW